MSAWSFPDHPRGWYFGAASAALRPGRPVAARVAGMPLTLARQELGRVVALSASGAKLLVAERNGVVLVFAGEGEAPAPPVFTEPRATRVGRRVRLRCHWAAVVANAFDCQHLGVVHRRELVGGVTVARTADRFRLDYVSRVTGSSLADRVTEWLSGGEVHASIACWSGTTLVVESRLSRLRASLMLCLEPDGGDVTVTPIVGVPLDAPFPAARARAAARLYGAFLERDIALLDGMCFRPAPVLPEDAALAACLDFLASLPSAGERPGQVAADVERGRLHVAEPLATRGAFVE